MSDLAPFSVVIPLFNKGRLVRKAIDSVLAGTLLPQEIVVIDDGSTDDGPSLVRAVCHPAVRLVSQLNAGVSAARNRGIREASGDFIAFLDADDLWEPDHLQRLNVLTKTFPEATFFATGYYLLYPDSSTVPPRIKGLDVATGPRLIERFYEVWSRGNFFFTSSVAVSRHFLDANDLIFPEQEKLGEDQEMWFRLAELGPVAYDPSHSAGYRQDVGQSLSQVRLPLTPLPYIARLTERFESGALPAIHTQGVTRLLSTNQVDRALRHSRQGLNRQAFQLLFHPLSRKAGLFWWRSLFIILLNSLKTSRKEVLQ